MFTRNTPAWVTVGGMALTCGAGCINAVGFLGQYHQAITHLSGTVSILSVDLAGANYDGAQRALLVVLFFFVGCFTSGFIVRQSTLRLGRRYGVALAFESALLFAAVYFLRRGSVTGDYLASMACGLQNAMATSYSGAVIRTTHMTGIITDLGIAAGHFVRRQPVDVRRVRLYLALLLGFFFGGVLGALGFARFSYDTLLFPAAIAGAAGIGYTSYKHYEQRRHSPPAEAEN